MINMDRIYLVTDLPGYTPQISRLLSMMNYTRFTVTAEVQDLTVEQLDFQLDEKSNSIGALLSHMAAVEYFYQVYTFEQRKELTEEEIKRWEPALNLGEDGREHIKGYDVHFYLRQLEEVRARTFELFKTVDDDWLAIQKPFWYGKEANHYFMWFHVVEDELNHRGQIRMTKKRAIAIAER
jgi:Protein of unknown function (DUF664).